MASSRDPLTLTGSILTVDTSGSYLFPSQITSPFTESKQPLVTTTVIDITNTLTPGGSLTCYPAITMSISGTILNVTGSTTSLATGAPLVINYATYTYTPGPAGINGQYSLDDKVTLSAVSTAYGPNVTFWQSVYVSLDQYQSSITLNSGSTAMPTLIGGSSLHSASSVPSTSMAPSPGSTASSSRNATSSTSGTKSSTSGGSSHTGIHKAAHKYSSGEIAGAAVGTGVGAAILAFLLAFLLRSRRRSNLDRSRSLARASPGSPPPFVEKSSTSKAPQIVDIMPFTGGSSSWMEHLPQPMDDETMRRTIKTLHDQIQLHVENFYHDVAVPQVSETAQTELYRLDSELVHPSLYKLMLQAKAKTALIKHSLAHLLFTSIDHNEASRTGHTSFLPQEFVGLLAIRGLEQRSYQAPSLKPGNDDRFEALRTLLTACQQRLKLCPSTAY